MDTTTQEALAEIRQAAHENASIQASHGDLLRIIIERQNQLIELLTPKEKDGPSLDEILGHMAGQLSELTGYNRQTVKMLGGVEQNLPGDTARAVVALLNPKAVVNGAASDGDRRG